MDYIRSFDIRISKDIYYAGEQIAGVVIIENIENIKIRGIRVLLRGKAHAQMKITKSGERRTVKDDQYLLDEKAVIFGKDKHDDNDGHIPILPRGMHQLAFNFQLPQCALPCSLESKLGTIRYYIKVVIDVPYASSPQGIKYFTIVGPHIDCMDAKYLSALVGQDQKTSCCLCCQRGLTALRLTLERTAYVCGESIRLRAQIENQSDQSVVVRIRLVQFVEYFIDKGVLGESKGLSCTVLEHRSPQFAPFAQGKYDSTLDQPIKLPVVPPTLIGVCRLIQIYYILKICLEDEKGNETLPMDFPLTIATVPYRIPNASAPPMIEYDFCSEHVEGGKYISPEFRLGQVYDGAQTTTDRGALNDDDIVLYRPVYVRIASTDRPLTTPRYSRDYGTDQPTLISTGGGAFTVKQPDTTIQLNNERKTSGTIRSNCPLYTTRGGTATNGAGRKISAGNRKQPINDADDTIDQKIIVDLHQLPITTTTTTNNHQSAKMIALIDENDDAGGSSEPLLLDNNTDQQHQ